MLGGSRAVILGCALLRASKDERPEIFATTAAVVLRGSLALAPQHDGKGLRVLGETGRILGQALPHDGAKVAKFFQISRARP